MRDAISTSIRTLGRAMVFSVPSCRWEDVGKCGLLKRRREDAIYLG
jgi:hypothetical protein